MMGSFLNAAREMVVKAGQSAMVASCTENVIFGVESVRVLLD